MNRVFRVQLAKLLKEKEDLVRKCQQQQQQLDHQQPNCNGTSNSNPSPVELQKLVHENSILRIDKKRVEDQLQVNTTFSITLTISKMRCFTLTICSTTGDEGERAAPIRKYAQSPGRQGPRIDSASKAVAPADRTSGKLEKIKIKICAELRKRAMNSYVQP